MAARSILACTCAGALLVGCSASTSASHVATANDIEARSALDAETPAPSASTNEEPSASSGAYYEPDPGGYVSAVLRRDAPNMRYVRLDRDTCETELGKRGIAFERANVPGVLAPVRLRGPLRGVTFHSELSATERAKSTLEIFDCRLVLALDDFSALLAAHDVVDVVHLSAFRTKAQGGCTPKYSGKQHCAALAVDLAVFKKKDGSTLSVDRDFHGKIGLRTCVASVRNQPRPRASAELWGFVCDAADRAIFHVMLTPNFNRQHKNHFHVELTPDAGWMLVK